MSVKNLANDKLKFYEQILLREKAETLSLISEISTTQRKGAKNSSGDLSSFSLHQADQGTDTDQMEKEVYLLEEEQKKLKFINRALKRIYDETYGICEICGEYIPDARLKIIPYAEYCIQCKSREETRKRGR